MFEKKETNLAGCYIIKPRTFKDNRGTFTKLFHEEFYKHAGLSEKFGEVYHSTSRKGVVRGLHFQAPPHAHVKLITCLSGELFDAVVDLRKDSPSYGHHFSISISADNPTLVYIPEGMAHGFMSLQEQTIFLNFTSQVFNPAADSGIHWDSCGINWPETPTIISEKDRNMPAFKDFKSPF